MTEQVNPFALPRLIATFRIPQTSGVSIDKHEFFDVKFYPYHTGTEEPPIFAVVGGRDVLIFRATVSEEGVVQLNHQLRDQEAVGPEKLPVLNTCTWAFIDQSKPLLAVSGPSGEIKVFDALSGEIFTSLVGHGVGLINDLATHPIYPWIVASASLDFSIRIWDLRRWNEKHESPCIIICSQGQGHKEGLLKIAWHSSGRYLVSGAHDHLVCLWTIPDLSPTSAFWVETSKANRKRKSDAVKVIHYPHFTTSAIHADYVDCVCFCGDLILSKASAENKIVLWEVTGFNSELPPPGPERAPKTKEHKDTRNGFMQSGVPLTGALRDGHDSESHGQDADTPLFTRRLELSLPDAQPFYMRFGLLEPSLQHPDLHTVLACGNVKSQILIWDFKRLELGHTSGYRTLPQGGPAKYEKYIENVKVKAPKKHGLAALDLSASSSNTLRRTPGSPASSTIVGSPSTDRTDQTRAMPEEDREKYKISDPFTQVKPHKTIHLPEAMSPYSLQTCFRAVSWSVCGRWCVVVGSSARDETGKKADASGALLARWV